MYRLEAAIREMGMGPRKAADHEASLPEVRGSEAIGEASDGIKPASLPSVAKDENRDRDAAGREIPDAGGESDGDAPR